MKHNSKNFTVKSHNEQTAMKNINISDTTLPNKKLELEYKAASNHFDAIVVSISKDAEQAHKSNPDNFPFLTNKRHRY